MAELSIRDESTDQAWRIWPDAETIASGSVHETGSYLFELKGSPGASGSDLLIDDTPLEALRANEPETARWRWSPGFHAGTVEVELRLPGTRPKCFEVVTDPDLRKLTRNDFDCMIREILEDTFALFALSSFREGVARGVGGRAPPIARLEFLRSRVEALEESAEAIAQKPRRALRADEVAVPYYQAARATGPEILRSFRSGRVRRESGSPSRLPVALKGFLPDRISLSRRRSSLDLPEHRQIAACLNSWHAWLSASAGLLDRGDPSDDAEARQSSAAWARRCRQLAWRIRRLRDLEPFAGAGEAHPRLLLSSIFRNDPAYRKFFRLWQDMNRGIAAVFGEFLGMPLARTFDLYELWCFLRLVRVAVDEYGSEGLDISDFIVGDASGGVRVRMGAVAVGIGSGGKSRWKLCFQKTYREFWKEDCGQGSYSRPMRPDIVLSSGPDGDSGRLIVLDAKYRIEEGLREAINSIHTYRDALVREAETDIVEGIVKAAYLLAPHVPDLDGESGYRETNMPGRLFHPEYRRGFRFGAVSMRPGMEMSELGHVLRMIISDATEKGLDG